MPFQHAPSAAINPAAAHANPHIDSSSTKGPPTTRRQTPPHQRLPQGIPGRAVAQKPPRDPVDRSGSAAASSGTPAPLQPARPPTDIASALIAYQRRQARSSDNKGGGGRSRSGRRAGNKEGAEAVSSDETHRDKSATDSGPVTASTAEPRKGTRNAVSLEDAAALGKTSAGSKQNAEVVKGAAATAGRRSRQTSEKGVLPDLRLPERSRVEQPSVSQPALAATSAASRTAPGFSRRERGNRLTESRQAPASQEFGGARDGRQLFDPRRHDPVKFASQQRIQPGTIEGQPRPATNGSGPSVVRSGQPSASRESRVESFAAASQASVAGVPHYVSGGPEISSTYTLQMHVQEIKQLYRRICLLETKLQQAHRSEADKQRDASPLDRQPCQQNLNHEYWLKLAADHRELAELQSAFLEMTLRSDMPESVQELPRTYNLPTRLWQTAFHMMLERLRHSLPSAQQVRGAGNCGSELLDHLTEFIYFAYSFYTTLFETEKFRAFRRAWIESLGDLARYRMAVAGLAASLSLDDGSGVRNRERRTSHKDAESMRIDDEDDCAESLIDGASIGNDALGDWDFVEKETWRQTARDWYARGLAETPNVGRLHHHLGILSRGDELRALYHLCRSLTAAHPFGSAKETILSLFDQEHQARRLQGDASVEDLFIYLHGTLVSRVQLDHFNEVFARLREKMGSEGVIGFQRPLSEATWMAMATINAAGLLQYGADSSVVLHSILRKSARTADGRTARTNKGKAATPTAIMVNHNPKVEDVHVEALSHQTDAWEEGSDDLSDVGDEAAVIQLESKDDAQEQGEDVPITMTYAMRLGFFMLDSCLQQSRREGAELNPYVTEFLTFVFSVVRFKPVYRLFERHVPWQSLVELMRSIPAEVVAKASKDTAPYITGKYPLPEDWCLRGTVGIGKQTYDRALWKKSCASTSSSSLPVFRTETEVLDSEDMELHSKFQTAPSTARGGRSLSLEDLRLHRLAFVAYRLAKTSRGLDFDPRDQRFSISKPLHSKLSRWRAEEEQQRLQEQLEMMKVAKSLDLSSRNALLTQEDLFSSDSDMDDEAIAVEGESEQVRQLRERKRYLKSVLRSTRAILETTSNAQKPTSRGSRPAAGQKKPFSFHRVLPGYTVLLMDTNVLVTPGDLLKQLVESQKWTVVVPLAVVTELDGLKRNANALGAEASRAIQFLESRIRSHAKYLKVQTSRGNYLTDLSIRSEDMQLGRPLDVFAQEEQPSTQKSLAARNVDEVIVRCLGWQTDHFVDRLALFAAHPEAERLRLQPDTAKAALLTLDRNLRLKAKARGLCSLDEQDIAELMIMTAEQSLSPAGGGGAARSQRDVGS
ncbi:hypothetical protein ACQY0O_002183 [Thecaphora frezii]